MNKLIIIGNGFDLAHNLKTDYKSFLIWYFEDCFTKAFESKSYQDDFLAIDVEVLYDASFINADYIGSFNNFIYDYITGVIPQSGALILDFNNLTRVLYTLNISFSSSLLEQLLGKKGDPTWGDIEYVFYQELKKILKENASVLETKQKLTTLNTHLDLVKKLLKKYLLIETENVVADKQFMDLVTKKIDLSHILEEEKIIHVIDVSGDREEKIEKVAFLDFNYTSLIKKTITSNLAYKYIPIHGTITGPLEEMIFGYGDEIDDVFHEMEKANINEYMHNIKSFGYFKNHYYSDLVRYIHSHSFIVYLWGHSCSLSDRTLLNMVFEHDNCMGIEIFYFESGGKDNYNELTQNISRHFKDKLKMRTRVFNANYCQALPQKIVANT